MCFVVAARALRQYRSTIRARGQHMKQIRATGRHLASACIAFGILASARAARPAVDRRVAARRRAAAGAPTQGGVAQLLQAYVGANQQVLTGQSSLASAMGLTGAAGQAQQAASQLAGGNALTPAALSQMGGAQQSVSQALGWLRERRCDGPDRQAGIQQRPRVARAGATQYSQLQSGRQSRFDERGVAVAVGNPQNMQAASYIAQSAPASCSRSRRRSARPCSSRRARHFGAVGRIVR